MSAPALVPILALIGVLVFGLAIALRSWRTWVIGYCFIALAVTVFGCTEWQAQRASARHEEVR